MQQHRGVLILVLGIISLVMCQILGIAPWLMGNTDLQAMDRGEMDPEGRGMTQAGKILGIISIVLVVLSIFGGLAVLLLGGGLVALEGR